MMNTNTKDLGETSEETNSPEAMEPVNTSIKYLFIAAGVFITIYSTAFVYTLFKDYTYFHSI